MMFVVQYLDEKLNVLRIRLETANAGGQRTHFVNEEHLSAFPQSKIENAGLVAVQQLLFS